MGEDQEEVRTKKLINLIIGSAIVLILVSFVAPWLLTSFSIVDLSDKGTIGDAVGGLMNPFIALAGVILTFVAFYIQYQANNYQRKQFNIQLEKEKQQFRIELEEQREQFLKNQFENQFYEMLSIHRSNINELTTVGLEFETKDFSISVSNFKEIQGVKSLTYLLSEFELCFKLVEKHWPTIENIRKMNEAYSLFWNGIDHNDKREHPFFEEAKAIKERSSGLILKGKSNQLAHYYRQLFQTVKFIVNQPIYNYEEKRNFIRILRSQLPNEEQVLLFYNWYSGFGYQWESDENKFFSDYRMIHNIFPSMLIPTGIDLKEMFFREDILVERNRSKDSLFEFEDWE